MCSLILLDMTQMCAIQRFLNVALAIPAITIEISNLELEMEIYYLPSPLNSNEVLQNHGLSVYEALGIKKLLV